MCQWKPASAARRSSAPSPPSPRSPTNKRSSTKPTTPNTAWSATSTPEICSEPCESPKPCRPAWSASTKAWCPTQPPPSAGSSTPASAAKAARSAATNSSKPNTSPSAACDQQLRLCAGAGVPRAQARRLVARHHHVQPVQRVPHVLFQSADHQLLVPGLDRVHQPLVLVQQRLHIRLVLVLQRRQAHPRLHEQRLRHPLQASTAADPHQRLVELLIG